MGAMLIGFALGLVAGAASGTAMGAFGGASLGMFVGLVLHGLSRARSRLGDAPTLEQHRVMCTSFGHAAVATFEGDLGSRRWYDVKRCSLLDPAARVACDKRCLHQLTLAGVRPGTPCDCDATVTAP